jgi:hypothetical protein
MRDVGMTGAELAIVATPSSFRTKSRQGTEAVERRDARSASRRRCSNASFPTPAGGSAVSAGTFGPVHLEDQPARTRRAFEVAERTGARIIRVFFLLAHHRPERGFDRVASALRALPTRRCRVES